MKQKGTLKKSIRLLVLGTQLCGCGASIDDLCAQGNGEKAYSKAAVTKSAMLKLKM